MKKSHFSQLGWTLSLFFVVLYIICLAWSSLLTDSALQTLHGQLLALTFPGFAWISLGSFVWGLILSFIYGWIGAGIFVWLHKFCCREEGKSEAKGNCCN